MTDIISKKIYVQKQTQFRKHRCHWPDCDNQIPPAMWGCKIHWCKLPKKLRDKIWQTYIPGQEISLTPSEKYLNVTTEVEMWMKKEGYLK